ncbi:MAG TPA: hypothetical protein PLK94_11255 [Alphaproteobacteria bacterium]|nr:hypothetical protein [Alphaproteobacteria bacterium]HOO51854.1 hypothetical protein [Alphaproteobacteria bacterium]
MFTVAVYGFEDRWYESSLIKHFSRIADFLECGFPDKDDDSEGHKTSQVWLSVANTAISEFEEDLGERVNHIFNLNSDTKLLPFDTLSAVFSIHAKRLKDIAGVLGLEWIPDFEKDLVNVEWLRFEIDG